MRYKTLALMALLLCLLFSYACTGGGLPSLPAAVHTPTPLSEWDEEGGLSALAAGTANAPERSLTGVVLYRDKENIVLSVDGATVSVPAAYVSDVMLGPGDIATLSYKGMIAYQPQFSSVQKTGSSVVSNTVFGEVSGIEDDVLHVHIESGELYSFELDKRTVFHGADGDSFRAGDPVMVVFDGKLAGEPRALDVTMLILDGAPTPLNRSLEGVVSALDDKQITLIADDNASYTFLRNFATEVIEPPPLKAGARVRVTFDGYAAQSPLAKEIEVIKAYATPKPVSAGSATGEAALSWLPTRTTNPMAGMPFSYIYYAGYPPAWVDTNCRDNCGSSTPAPTTAPSTGTGGSTVTTPVPTPTPGTSDDPGPGTDPGGSPDIPPPSRPEQLTQSLLEYINTRREAHLSSDGALLPLQWMLYLDPEYNATAAQNAQKLAMDEFMTPESNALIARIRRTEGYEPARTYVAAVSQWESNPRDQLLLYDPNLDMGGIGVYSDAEYDYYYVYLGR